MTLSHRSASTRRARPIPDTHDGSVPPSIRSSGPIAELDGLRGVAILMVFLHHYVPAGGQGSPPHRLLGATVESLWCGVDLFFVLSGFLITGILLDTRGLPGYYRTFFARRSLRIFPPYFGLLAVVFGVLPWLVPMGSPTDRVLVANQGWLWAYAANVRIARAGYRPFWGDHVALSHLWSLAVEEHFYLIWPVVVASCSPRRLWAVCLAGVAGAFSLRFGLALNWCRPEIAYVATPCRVDALTIGAMVALALRSGWTNPARLRRAASLLLIGAGVALGAVLAVRGVLSREDRIVMTGGYTLLALFSAGLILGSLGFDPAGGFRRALRLGGLRALGRLSYGFYLVHYAIEPTLNSVLSNAAIQAATRVSSPVAGLIRVGTSFAICLGLAWLSWTLFERPILRLKRRFEYDRPAGVASPTLLKG